MRDHDLELIAALVEGRLQDESEARALIASSAEAREEYEAQRLAFESLQAIGPARLADAERAALHRDVWTQLGARAPAKRARSPWYYRWAAVAAGMFVIVGLVAVLTQGGQEAGTVFRDLAAGQGGGDGAGDPTTTAAEAATAADESGDDMASQESGPTTTAAMTEETFAAAGGAAPFYETEAERVRRGEYTGRLRLYDEDQDVDVQDCLETAGLSGYVPVATLVSPDETDEGVADSFLVAAPEESNLAEAPLAFVDSTCEMVYLDEPPG